jgi:hypothetical protein
MHQQRRGVEEALWRLRHAHRAVSRETLQLRLGALRQPLRREHRQRNLPACRLRHRRQRFSQSAASIATQST